jgi:tetratricopeptide (TPR) repeat protein
LRGREDHSQHTSPGHSFLHSKALEPAAAAAAFLVALAAYTGATNYFFSQDDFTFLARSIGLAPSPDFLGPLGARVLSTRLYFDLMHGLFGLNPEPYHWASVLLHALNSLLVYAVARRWTGSLASAAAAALIFATLDLAFTAVYWISGVQDLLATFFLLVSALVWVSRSQKGAVLSFVSAGFLALSLLSKETGLAAIVPLAAMAWAQRSQLRRTAVALIPHAAVTAAAAALFLMQSRKVPEGGAYGAGLSADLLHNLATYVKWTIDVIHPYKDQFAVIDYAAWKTALPAAAVLIVFILLLRGERRRFAWASACWYLLLLAPVLPLVRHTYLYYLYPAAAGAAMLAGFLLAALFGALSRSAAPRGSTIGALLGFAAVGLMCFMGVKNIGAREGLRLEPDYVLPRDHVLRAAELARAADSTFVEARVPKEAGLVLINPYSPESVDLSGGARPGAEKRTYDLVRKALREGDVLRVRRPDLGEISFASRMEIRHERDHGLLYDAYGRLTYLGTGADIWANLSTVHLLRTSLLDESIRCARRALELAPEQPRASLNLGVALAMTGKVEEARGHLERAERTLPSEPLREQARRWLVTLSSQ